MADPSTSASAFANLPPSVQAQLTASAPPGTRDASAAGDLAWTVVRGGVPTEGQIVAGLGGLATLVGGPAAGMAMGAIGAGVMAFSDVLQAMFAALGLYGATPAYGYQGLQRTTDQKPSGPTDPNWIHVTTLPEWAAVQGLAWGPHPPSLPGGRPPYSPDYASINSAFQAYWSPTRGGLGLVIRSLLSPAERWRWDHGSWQGGKFLPSTAAPSPSDLADERYRALTPFETYFARVLLANMQFWANALPFVPPQELLGACVSVWNAQNKTGKSTLYSPAPEDSPAANLVSIVLSGLGDSTGANRDAVPVLVNAPGAAPPRTAAPLRFLGWLAGTAGLLALLVGGGVALVVHGEKGARTRADRF